MAALEVLKRQGLVQGEQNGVRKGQFRFVIYERSSECRNVKDSSVSYASAYAVL